MSPNSFSRENSSGYIFQNLRYVKFRLAKDQTSLFFYNKNLFIKFYIKHHLADLYFSKPFFFSGDYFVIGIALFSTLYLRIRSFPPEHY